MSTVLIAGLIKQSQTRSSVYAQLKTHTTHRLFDIVLLVVDDIFLNLSCKSGYMFSLSLSGEHRFPINTTQQQATTIFELFVDARLSVWVRHYFPTSFSLYFFISLSLPLYFSLSLSLSLYVCNNISLLHCFEFQ